jgi:hypothetical protein
MVTSGMVSKRTNARKCMIVYYTHCVPHICFGQSCGHLQGGAIQRIIHPPSGATARSASGSRHYRGFMITLRHTTVGRSPLYEGSARRRDFYLTTHNIGKRQTFMPPVGFEPAILARERPRSHALDRAATGIGTRNTYTEMLQNA